MLWQLWSEKFAYRLHRSLSVGRGSAACSEMDWAEAARLSNGWGDAASAESRSPTRVGPEDWRAVPRLPASTGLAVLTEEAQNRSWSIGAGADA